jgi:hypothetical protein
MPAITLALNAIPTLNIIALSALLTNFYMMENALTSALTSTQLSIIILFNSAKYVVLIVSIVNHPVLNALFVMV